MDELSIQGYWSENSENFAVSGTDKTTLIPYSTQQYVVSTTSTDLCISSYWNTYEEEPRNTDESSHVYPDIEEHVETISFMLSETTPSPDGPGELDQTFLNQPCSSVNYKLMMVVDHLKEFAEDFDVLVQIWVPVYAGDTIVLTTNDELYAVGRTSRELQSYRSVSKAYQFPAEFRSKTSTGLPGRAFSGKVLEWSPDVRLFESNECPRLNYAKLYSICGCLAMPVFERAAGACVAVVEIVTTVQKMSYHLELENICKALETVDLKGSQDFHPFNIMNCSVIFQDTVSEIVDVMKSVCKNANLPLALTWTLCSPESRSGYDQIENQYSPCFSTVRSACFITDAKFLGFYMASSEQYLSMDQGIVGKSFLKRTQNFSADITCFSKSDYPLSHHAKIFGLRAALAIPLQNIHTGSIDFVVELFFPVNCHDHHEQKMMWEFLSDGLKQAFQSFHVVMDKEFTGDINGEFLNYSSKESYSEDSYEIPAVGEALLNESECVSSERPNELKEELDLMDSCFQDENDADFHSNHEHFELEKLPQSSEQRTGVQDSCIGQFHLLRIRKSGKRRAKTQKTISLQVIRQYFAENLKDAAKSIGVCPTTLKRICRQHGITRWPSRKIKKVNHSLKKLQLVVDSVQGAKGLIQIGIDSNTPSFPSSQNHKPGLSCCREVNQPFTMFNEDAPVVQDPVAALKQSFSTSELRYLKDEPVLIDQYFSSKLPQTSKENTEDSRSLRVKATFGEEKIRFSMPLDWNFEGLQREICRRFNIKDFSRIHMKYIDNDDDTIHLDCDADLKEFKELFKDYLSNTIRISLYASK